MNPKGQVLDIKSLRHLGHQIIDAPPLSPEICSSLVKDLHTPKGKGFCRHLLLINIYSAFLNSFLSFRVSGAALFAKRKQKSEKWIVDENTVKQKTANNTVPSTPAAQPPTSSSTPAVPTNNPRADQNQQIASVQVN